MLHGSKQIGKFLANFERKFRWTGYGIREDEAAAMSPMFPAAGLEKVIYPDLPN